MTTTTTATATPEVPRLRLGLLLWLTGMAGTAAVTFMVLPGVLRDMAPSMPLPTILLASLAQSGLLVALAVWAGVRLAPQVGLRAPVYEAAATARPLAAALKSLVAPGIAAGALGGVALFAAIRYAPAALADVQARFPLSLIARVLYGGITEELLLRWGLMTTLVWLAWRVLQGRKGAPQAIHIWLSIVVSALLFGVGHLPAAAALAGTLSGDMVVFVVGVNAAFGVLFGYLFWRYSLETAMIAHGTTHIVAYALGMI